MLKISLGYQVLFAVLLGILVGLFFGPLTEGLKPIGDIYTMLLQMAVLPYISFSLIHGLGSVTPTVGKKLFRSGWPFLLTLWVLIFVVIYVIIQLIPTTISPLIQAGNAETFESNFTKNFLTYLVPQNPLYDITNNIVPAVAIFGLIGGIALMHVEKKEPLIGLLERMIQTIEKILKWLGILSPVGAFVYIAIAFGTIHFEDLAKLQVYVFAFIFTTLFITFAILPALLIYLTPLKYKEVIKAFRYVCLIPLVTGLSTTALPFLTMYLRKLSQKHETHEKFRETSQTVLPIAYSFGNIGNAMILFFITFLTYYYRHPFGIFERWLVPLLTIPMSIGSSSSNLNSIFFLIKQLGFPESAGDFFLQIKSVTYNFQVMMSIASVLTLIILTLYSYYGLLQVRWKPLLLRLSGYLALFVIVIFSIRAILPLQDVYQTLYKTLKLSDVISNPVKAEILTPEETGSPRTFSNTEVPRIFDQILNSHILKVGFNSDSIPFCYYNEDHELVGFDIAYAYSLANDLDCTIQFVPFSFHQIGAELLAGKFDIGMSSIIISESRLIDMEFTFPYFQDNNVLIVSNEKKNRFLHLKDFVQSSNLVVGAGGAQIEIAKHLFPKAKIIDIETDQDLFNKEIDVILWSETTAVIWCLYHPDFVTISYGTELGRSYFGYPIRKHATDLGFFLNSWMNLKEQSGFKKRMHSYWIDGIVPKEKKPRWSILRNVLHFPKE